MELPAKHLVTHAVVVGMTGSGKTGLVTVLVEEAARAKVPTLVIDVKGDLSNLLLRFPDFAPADFEPWVERERDDLSVEELAQRAQHLAERHESALRDWSLGRTEVAAYAAATRIRVLTPGASAGEPLHMLSSLERPSSHWSSDPETARDALSAAVSLVLRLLGRDPDPAKSREHVLLSVLAERRLAAGGAADLAALMEDVLEPPMDEIGALPVNSFIKATERRSLAAALNTLLASPTLASWRQGADLDVASWMKPQDGQTPITIVNVSHLDDEERSLVRHRPRHLRRAPRRAGHLPQAPRAPLVHHPQRPLHLGAAAPAPTPNHLPPPRPDDSRGAAAGAKHGGEHASQRPPSLPMSPSQVSNHASSIVGLDASRGADPSANAE